MTDYDPASIPQALTFSPGDTEECFDVEIVNDTVNEPTETFTISGRPEGSSDPPASTTVTIEDDDSEEVFPHTPKCCIFNCNCLDYKNLSI